MNLVRESLLSQCPQNTTPNERWENMSHEIHINNPTLKNHHEGKQKNLDRTLILKSNIHGNNECVSSTTLVSVNEME
jgi:hypothetical protein